MGGHLRNLIHNLGNGPGLGNDKPDALFFLTDTDNPMAAGDVSQSIELARRNGTAIHAIEFGFQVNPGRDNFLVQLARGTGGQYAYVDTARLGRGGVTP